jgi:hypothetical protein
MLVQLPNGKTIEMSFEEWDSLTDNDFQYYMSTNQGEEIQDPFFGSVLKDSPKASEDEIAALTDIPDEVKLHDKEFTQED